MVLMGFSIWALFLLYVNFIMCYLYKDKLEIMGFLFIERGFCRVDFSPKKITTPLRMNKYFLHWNLM